MYQPPKDMKSLTFVSIYKESFNIISSNTKLFTQIAIFLTFPYSLVNHAYTPLSFLFPNTTNPPNNTFANLYATTSSWKLAAFILYKIAYLVLTMALSLLSFSSVTYAVACISTEHTNISFKTVICAFKKAWKKLVLTTLAELVPFVGYTLLVGLLSLIAPFRAVSSGRFSSGRYQLVGSLAMLILTLVFSGGLVYINIVWIFGGTVAVLECSYGFKALSKSKSLIKGKAFFTIMVLLPISACRLLLSWMFIMILVNGGVGGFGIVTRIGCGVLGLPVIVGLVVFAVVVRTVTYLVCKADKDESITKSSVMDHLDIYVDGYAYAPLVKAKDEQI